MRDNKGVRSKCECQECHATRFVEAREWNRAGRPRCHGCGSARLEPVTKEAQEAQARLQRNRVAGPTRSMAQSTDLDGPRKKVT